MTVFLVEDQRVLISWLGYLGLALTMITSTSSSWLSKLVTYSLFGMQKMPCLTADTVSCFLAVCNTASSANYKYTLNALLAKSDMVASCFIDVMKSRFRFVFIFTLIFFPAFLRQNSSYTYIQILLLSKYRSKLMDIAISFYSIALNLLPQQIAIYFYLSFSMGNACETCQKTDTKDSLRDGIKKESDKNNAAPQNPPFRPSLSKNDEKYFELVENSIDKTAFKDQIEKREAVKFKNGVIYHGEWKGNVREGYGVQVWPDGAKYEGEWQDGKANGKGKFTHIDGDIYQGDWKDDKACGFGTYKHFNGAKYEGQWLDDYQHGKGIQTWVDGSKYDGHYFEGKKNGEGRYVWRDGSYYFGTWKDNKINGFGTYVWSDGRQYKGQWVNNQMHGNGEYKWKDGRMYVGQYKNDKKHGLGTYTWTDGKKYVGEWVNSKRHGRGKIVSPDGSERQGVWQQDRRLKWLQDSAGPTQSKINKRL